MKAEEGLINTITLDEDIAKISVIGVPDKPGIAFKLFRNIAKEGVRIDSIVQNVNRDSINDITFIIPTEELETAFRVTEEYSKEVGAVKAEYDKDVAKLSVIGSAIIANANVASKFFNALYKANINIRVITTSEVKISCIIERGAAKEALKALYKEFE